MRVLFVRLLLSVFALRPLLSRSPYWSSPTLFGSVPSRRRAVLADLRGVWVWDSVCLWGGAVPASDVSAREAWSLVVHGR